MKKENEKHWLYRKKNIPILWGIQIFILFLALIPEFFMHHHPHFSNANVTIDASWGFFAWYGFLTCAAMVIAAKILGIFLKRKDSYYDE